MMNPAPHNSQYTYYPNSNYTANQVDYYPSALAGISGVNTSLHQTVTSQPKCARCNVHGFEPEWNEQKHECMFRNCNCLNCKLIMKRYAPHRAQKNETTSTRLPPRESDVIRPTPRNIASPYPSAFTLINGGLDPNQKYKAMERFHCLLMRKLGDSYDLLPLLVLAVLAEYNFDPDEVKRKIQSGVQEQLDMMNMVLGMGPDDDYVDVNFYTDDDENDEVDDDEDESDEIPDEAEPCPRSLE